MALLSFSNPMHPANRLTSCIQSHIGSDDHAWVHRVTGIGMGSAWCAATVVAAGKELKLGSVIPDGFKYSGGDDKLSTSYAGGVGRYIVENLGGTRYSGPYWGYKNVIPCTGDIVCFIRNNSWGKQVAIDYKKGVTWRFYSASHVGVVTHVDVNKTDPSKSTVHTIEGNTGGSGEADGRIKTHSYNVNDTYIAFYARPKWSKAGGIDCDTYATAGTYVPGATPTNSTYKVDDVNYSTQLYTTASTKADASIREVAFLGSDGKPSIKSEDVRLAVLNYTGMLNGLYQLQNGGIGGIGGSPDNIDALDSVPRTIVQYLTQHGLNTAAAVGFIANIEAESSFNTACRGDKENGVYTSFGICQWHNKRGKAMMDMAGPNWANNLTGQLDYLWSELQTDYYKTRVLNPLLEVPNTLVGAQDAAEIVVRKFEVPNDMEGAVGRRRNAATRFWNQIVVNSTTIGSALASGTPSTQVAPAGTPTMLLWPVPDVAVGTYSSGFGYRGDVGVEGATKYHGAVDIPASRGKKIVCSAAGVVYSTGYTGARGYNVIVDHGNKFYTRYQHMMQPTSLTKGQQVSAGTLVGYVGNTGLQGMSPHLHFEVLVNGVEKWEYNSTYKCNYNIYAVDPTPYFKSVKA